LHAYAVEFAKLFFPSEAQLAMRIAEADSTEQFSAIRLKEIGLNVAPEMHRKLRERFDALTKTGSSIDIILVHWCLIDVFLLIKGLQQSG
jgi:hypothetical protein